MLTIITGTPGAGKSLYTVWEIARKVPGSKLKDSKGGEVKRTLHSNIKNLLLPHEHITAKDLNTWQEWAKPGDVIVYDEVQEVWRPRGRTDTVPPCIAALETHRHMGVDIVLITQNPMLIDSNIRRLVNQHIHLRRVTKGSAYMYEWDACMDTPGSSYSKAMHAKLWWHPKAAYALYKSAELHTKPTVRLPKMAAFGLLAVAGLAYAAPTVYNRFQDRFAPTAAAQSPSPAPTAPAPVPKVAANERTDLSVAVAAQPVAVAPAPPVLLGCIALGPRCECFDGGGARIQVAQDVCSEGTHRVSYVQAASARASYGPQGHADVSRSRESPSSTQESAPPGRDSPSSSAPGPSVAAPAKLQPLGTSS